MSAGLASANRTATMPPVNSRPRCRVRLLQYKDHDVRSLCAAFDKVKATIEADGLRSAAVKKLYGVPVSRLIVH